MGKFRTADSYVPAPKPAYPGAPSGKQPEKARTQNYTPDLSTNNGSSNGTAPKHNKQPTEA